MPESAARERFWGWTTGAARVARAELVRRPSWPELILLIAIPAFIALITIISVERYLAFDLRGYDFGIYTSAAFSVARFQSAPVFPHFSPILYAVAPALWAFPSPTTLLVVQAVALGAAGFPMFWLGRSRLQNEWASLAATLALLFSFIPFALAWGGFAVECFLPAAFLAALYARERAHLVGFLVALSIALFATETALPFVAALGIFTIARWWWARSAGARAISDLRLGTGAVVLSGAWFAILLLLPRLYAGANSGSSAYFGGGYAVGWWNIGASSPAGVLPAVLLDPGAAWHQFLGSYPAAGVFLLLLLGVFGFLALFGPLDELLLALVWPVLAFVSSLAADASFGNAFAAYSLPFMAASALGGAAWIVHRIDDRQSRASTAVTVPVRTTPRRRGLWVVVAILVGGALVTTAVASPLLAVPVDATGSGVYGWPESSAHDAYLEDVLSLLPPDASVLTTNAVYPHLADDPNAKCAPISPYVDQGVSFPQFVQAEINSSEFVLLDFVLDWENTVLLVDFGNLSMFHVVAAINGIRLLERGPTAGFEVVPVAESWAVPISSLLPMNGAEDLASNGSTLLAGGPGVPDGGFVWEGPYWSALPPGVYELSMTLSVTSPTASTPVEVQVIQQQVGVVPVVLSQDGSSSFEAFDFVVAGEPQTTLAEVSFPVEPGVSTITFWLTFSWNGVNVLEVPGKLLDPAASVVLSSVSLTVVAPLV